MNFAPSPWANVQAGQFYLPFTLENRISDNTTAFLERALVVRTIGAPTPARHRRDVLGRVARPRPLLHGRHLQRRRPEPSQRRQPLRLRRTRVRAPVREVRRRARRSGRRLASRCTTGRATRTKVGYDMPAHDDVAGLRLLEADVHGLVRPPHPHPPERHAAGLRRRPLRADRRTSTSPASSSTRTTTRARPSTGCSCRRSPSALGALKGWGYYAQVGLLGHRRSRDPRLPELRPAHPRRPRAGAAAGAARLQLVARVDQLGLDYQGPSRGGDGRLEDAERRRRRDLLHPRAPTTGRRVTCA